MSEVHTPGPWKLRGEVCLVGDPKKPEGMHSLYCGDVRNDAHIGSICTIQSADHCPPDGITRDVAAANARLIAAAPEMLKALQVAHDLSLDGDHFAARACMLEAIAKALGEHS